MTKRIAQFIGITVIICMFSYIFCVFLNIWPNSFMNEITAEGTQTKMYVFDFASYFKNISLAFTNTFQLQLQLQTREWVNIAGADWFLDLTNNMAYCFNMFMIPINILLYPIRIIAYVLRGIFAILGAVITTFKSSITGITYNKWAFVDILDFIMSLQIPYI